MRDDVCQEIVSFKIHEVFGIWQFFQGKFQNANNLMLYVKLRPNSQEDVELWGEGEMLLKRLSNACQIQVMGFCASHARAIDDLVFKLTYY